jgi:hypothetical protein
MRSLSPEMKRVLMAELCERIMCSGGGAKGRRVEVINTGKQVAKSRL